ncbi:thiosulfate oxidation carrier protein SoxY [Roseomonas sp. AR75]|uniref:thiosulfate oxidation carrier protein SoxY n=1 Tax=Roseomonas sp. AR75 TaxID=2562311 RepID=UPI0010BFBA18|nr:thiosulfate oxidation carrier protein SoxY [Roseomonas sp. AR75]
MSLHRRTVLALPLAASATQAAAQSVTGESFAAAERAILAGRTPVAEGIVIDMPPLSENGNAVDLSIRVASPMTEADHVTAIHILSERNPFPRVARFGLSPRAGRAEVATRIRLATTQTVLVLAETSTGQVHRAGREVIVVLGACVDGG